MAASFSLIVTVLMIPFLASSHATIRQATYSKIVGVVHDTPCRLSTFTPFGNQISVEKACSIQCTKTTYCRFFCVDVTGHVCDLFSSYVAVRFPGHSTGITYSACYTSWGDPRDVIKTNTSVSYSTLVAGYYTTSATDGVACNTSPYTVSSKTPNSYFQIDLGAVIRVKSVTVVNAYADHFNNIIVYLGNFTSYSSNAVYGTRSGVAPAWTSTTIVGNASIAGLYLTILSPDNWYLGFCELQVNKN